MSDDLHSIALEGIGRHARWLQYSSREVVHFVGLLIAQRPFETEAQNQMELAETALVEALDRLRAAKSQFLSLPREAP